MKVFWSWQSDRKSKVCRALVKDALVEALDQLSDELDVRDSDRPEVDHDTKGKAGMVPIADTILEKISAAGVFVGDVTAISRTRKGRYLPNPNVLIELGWAWANLGDEKIILVANAAFGLKKAEQLPFDIRHRRAVIFYELPEMSTGSEIKATKKELVRQLREALRLSLKDWLQKSSDETGPSGRPHRSGDPSVWFEIGEAVQHQPFHGGGGMKSVATKEKPRIYVRIIPERTSSNPPDAREIHNGSALGNKISLQPLLPFVSGDGGLSEHGTVRYAVEPDSSSSWSIVQWFEENGEIWSFDSFRLSRNTFYLNNFVCEMSAFLQRGFEIMAAQGSIGLIRVEIGAVGLRGIQWSGQFNYERGDALKDQVICSEARRRWTDDARIELLLKAANAFASNFGKDPLTATNIKQILSEGL